MHKTILTALLLPFLLTGCFMGGDEAQGRSIDKSQMSPVAAKHPDAVSPENAVCPTVGIVEDLRSMTMFADNDSPNPDAILGYAKIEDFDGGCSFENGISTIELDIMFSGRLGSGTARRGRGTEPSVAFPYFIAISDAEGNILNKEVFAVALRFREGLDSTHQVEHLRPRIPLPDVSAASRYQVLVGFQLNRKQLDFNRGE